MADAVYLHIGVPKTGSTYLQEILWGNQERLAEVGYRLAAETYQDHVRAMVDLYQRRSGPRIVGAWDRLARRVRDAPGPVVISQEELCRASTEQARTALGSFGSARTTVVITARDMARQITSYWQQQVKSRFTGTLPEMIDVITSKQPTEDDFWGHQDLLAILDRWLAVVPPEQVVVVTLPPPGERPDLLWERFATACDLDPAGFDLDVEHPNESLGATQVELLRRLNVALGDRLPVLGGYAVVRRLVGNDLLATQRDHRPLALDASTHAWATSVSHEWMDGVRGSGVRVIGDLGELLPEPWEPSLPEASVDEWSINQCAVQVIADLLAQWEDRAGRPRRAALGARRREPGSTS